MHITLATVSGSECPQTFPLPDGVPPCDDLAAKNLNRNVRQ